MGNMSRKLAVFFLIGAVIIFAIEMLTEGGSLLFSMLFFVALAQGPLAVVAAVDIAGSDWLKPYKREMLSVYQMIPFIILLFIVFWIAGKLHLYSWSEHGNVWLNQVFFGWRNVIFLLISYFAAGKFAKESINETSQKTKWAVIWVLVFVVSQTLIAFDWVMSMEYPWISTLFGAYFFIEAFYAGVALAAIATFFNYQNYVNDYSAETFKKSQMDMMTLLFGFSIFWAYQFFSQYLVIWYGNIPEEVHFFTKRLEVFSDLLYLALFILFVIPFITLLSRKVKANPKAVMVIGSLIWIGLMLERIFMIGPEMQLNPLIAAFEFIITGGLFLWVLRNGEEVLVTA